jgi:hypothetical protein
MTTIGDEMMAPTDFRDVAAASRWPAVCLGFRGRAHVRNFVPLLVEHDVLIQLKDLAGKADLVARQREVSPHRALPA